MSKKSRNRILNLLRSTKLLTTPRFIASISLKSKPRLADFTSRSSRWLRENEHDSIPFTFNLETYINFLLAGPLVLECIDKLIKNSASKKETEQPTYQKRHVERMSICDYYKSDK